MQIFKRVKKTKAQNLIEFVFVFPILIFITLVIFEVTLYWQDVNAVYNLNAEINANISLVDIKHMKIGDTCTAATEALKILEDKDSSISLNNPTYNKTSPQIDGFPQGEEPFVLYQYVTGEVNIPAATAPQISLWVDCRSPFEDGVTTQIKFYHKNLIMKATIPRFDGGPGIEIIPEYTFIASPQLKTNRHY